MRNGGFASLFYMLKLVLMFAMKELEKMNYCSHNKLFDDEW